MFFMKKNDVYEIEIIDIGNNGEGIGKIDNFVVFIPYAIKGEIIKTLILKVNKNFAYGKILSIIKASEFRTEPPCPYFYKCGGCNIQHIKYEKQLEFKTNIVFNTLKKQVSEPFVVNNCIQSNNVYAYRNKMQLPCTINGIGMYRENSHNIIEIDNCLLSKNWIRTIINKIKEFIDTTKITLYNEQEHTGILRHILVREVDNTLSITLVINANDLQHKDVLINLLKQNFINLSLFYCVNKIKNNTILTPNIVCFYGSNTQYTSDFGIQYAISPNSFLQINRDVQNKIYSHILENISDSDIIIDAFSGAGLLSAILSQKAKHIYGIEIIESASKNADALMKKNSINNVTNINGDCTIELPLLMERLQDQYVSLVLDPPRKGCDENVINAINKAKPKEIFYISCNPATLARDLKGLENNYKINLIQPYDMFPQTKHIETLAILNLKNP